MTITDQTNRPLNSPFSEWGPRINAYVHSGCVICGTANSDGWHARFHRQSDGSVVAIHFCDDKFAGYSGILHGGIVAALLDAAMTNCLFAHHITAVTAEMTVRYLRPVHTGETVQLRAWIDKSNPRLYSLAAELRQDNQTACRATAKFIPKLAPES